MTLRTSPLLLAAFLLVLPGEASAYLDPGTGSYVLQLLLAGFFASLFTMKLYWQRLKDWFRGNKGGKSDEQR